MAFSLSLSLFLSLSLSPAKPLGGCCILNLWQRLVKIEIGGGLKTHFMKRMEKTRQNCDQDAYEINY